MNLIELNLAGTVFSVFIIVSLQNFPNVAFLCGDM